MSKNSIQKRRKQKIRQLMHQEQPVVKQPYTYKENDNKANPPRLSSKRLLEDPEYVWKHQPPPWAAEERYSALDSDVDVVGVQRSSRGRNKGLIKLLIGAALFISTFVLFQLDEPWAHQGQQWVQKTLTEHGDFQDVAKWYEETFAGSPVFIPVFQGLRNQENVEKADIVAKRTYYTPLAGQVVVPFEVNQEGVQVLPDEHDSIKSIDEGRVMFSGRNDRIGLAVIIQHPGQVWSIYGQLKETKLRQNDWVEGGEEIGTVNEIDGQLKPYYFALRVDGEIKNPVDVIKFNE